MSSLKKPLALRSSKSPFKISLSAPSLLRLFFMRWDRRVLLPLALAPLSSGTDGLLPVLTKRTGQAGKSAALPETPAARLGAVVQQKRSSPGRPVPPSRRRDCLAEPCRGSPCPPARQPTERIGSRAAPRSLPTPVPGQVQEPPGRPGRAGGPEGGSGRRGGARRAGHHVRP